MTDWWASWITGCCEPNKDGPRSRLSDKDRNASGSSLKCSSSTKLVGVGLIFDATRPGNTGLVVSSIPEGGPAYDSKQIVIGDELVSVDGTNVEEFDPALLAPYILGPPGSEVVLGFKSQEKSSSSAESRIKEVLLKRGSVRLQGLGISQLWKSWSRKKVEDLGQKMLDFARQDGQIPLPLFAQENSNQVTEIGTSQGASQ